MKIRCVIIFLTLTGCTGMTDGGNGALLDFIPPRLVKFDQRQTQLVFTFDEALTSARGEREGVPTSEENLLLEGNRLTITPEAQLPPGTLQKILLEVQDHRGNRNTLIQRFYPTNPQLPQVRIMEVCINGTATRPDMVELIILSPGNLAGLEIRDNYPLESGQSFVFPSLDVKERERILVHFKPQGIPEEVQEIAGKNSSGGIGAVEGVRDFWVPEATGLKGTNGLILLSASPEGEHMDCLLYSNRTSGSDEKYRGFGSRSFLESVDWVHTQGFWKIQGEKPTPEDCVFSGDSTSTRPLVRSENADTQGKEDWFTGAKPSFGVTNPALAYGNLSRG